MRQEEVLDASELHFLGCCYALKDVWAAEEVTCFISAEHEGCFQVTILSCDRLQIEPHFCDVSNSEEERKILRY